MNKFKKMLLTFTCLTGILSIANTDSGKTYSFSNIYGFLIENGFTYEYLFVNQLYESIRILLSRNLEIDIEKKVFQIETDPAKINYVIFYLPALKTNYSVYAYYSDGKELHEFSKYNTNLEAPNHIVESDSNGNGIIEENEKIAVWY